MSRDRPERRTLSGLDVAALMRDARGLAGLSQAQLAGRVGTTQAVVSRWERGAEVPRLDALARALQACGRRRHGAGTPGQSRSRTQIESALTLTPDERLESIVHTTELLGLARSAG